MNVKFQWVINLISMKNDDRIFFTNWWSFSDWYRCNWRITLLIKIFFKRFNYESERIKVDRIRYVFFTGGERQLLSNKQKEMDAKKRKKKKDCRCTVSMHFHFPNFSVISLETPVVASSTSPLVQFISLVSISEILSMFECQSSRNCSLLGDC